MGNDSGMAVTNVIKDESMVALRQYGKLCSLFRCVGVPPAPADVIHHVHEKQRDRGGEHEYVAPLRGKQWMPSRCSAHRL